MISFLIRVAAVCFGVSVIAYFLYIKFKHNIPWTGGGWRTHVHGFPWELVLPTLGLIAWALGDLWLYGGRKARRQAKFEAQRQAEQTQARASSPVEASAASEAPCSTKQPGDAP
jgi:hypothetical protein